MSEIIPQKLFLGNVLNVNRLQWLDQKGIQTIVCVASKDDVTIQENIKACKTVYQLELLDNLTQKLDFDSVISLIEDGMKHGAVLVNCVVGLSRSPAFVIAYLMKTQNMSLKEAYNEVRRARPKINPNSSFIRQLEEYQNSLFDPGR
jgi:protein-tyrosine phosphatase